MHRVAEKNLEHLNAAQLKNLVRKGILARIYAHLLSLENFARLLDRKGERPPPRSSSRLSKAATGCRGTATPGSRAPIAA